MKKYIGTEIIEAKEMCRGAYIKYRKTIPEGENPADGGYLIKYPDGCENWLSEKQFEGLHGNEFWHCPGTNERGM